MTSPGPDGTDGRLGQVTPDERVTGLSPSRSAGLVSQDRRLTDDVMARRLANGIGHGVHVATDGGLDPADTAPRCPIPERMP